MKIVEQCVFEVGDVFTGKGIIGEWLIPSAEILYAAQDHYLFVKEIGLGSVYLCSAGHSANFPPEELTDHLKQGNLVYLGNVYKGKAHA